MDTKKIGAFLKQCRKEKNLTQEQLAEKFEVSARTVSRWETGINMPDLSILVQLAEYYDVEMRELLDGERSQTMNKEMKETSENLQTAVGRKRHSLQYAFYCSDRKLVWGRNWYYGWVCLRNPAVYPGALYTFIFSGVL